VLRHRNEYPVEGVLPAFTGATAWLNSDGVDTSDLDGRVVLVSFGTYTCINWRRTVPYLRAWVERYGKSGLLLIGVHSPEFAFERDLDNVRQQAKGIPVCYPIAVDTDFAIWEAFGNQYWPAFYLVGRDGLIHGRAYGELHVGDGTARPVEALIDQLLSVAHP